jgi:Protein of unknown function DUF115
MAFNVEMENGWIENNNIVFKGYNFVDDNQLMDNIRSNLELIEEWIRPAKVHDMMAICVSAGPSTNLGELRKLIEDNPNHKVICVKHSYGILKRNGIIPWGVVILDTRPIMEKSTLGFHRLGLIDEIDERTICFIMTRSHPTYTFFCHKKGIRVIGFHNHYDEIAKCFGLKPNELDKDEQLSKEIKASMSNLPGSCAAICGINVMILLGFRDIHLFGYDGDFPDESKCLAKCKKVKTNGKVYNVPDEFISYGNEFQLIYEVYTRDLNCNITHHGTDSFLGGIYETMKPRLVGFEEAISHPYKKSQYLDDKLSKLFGGYFNKTNRTEEMIVLGYKSYDEYVKIQKIGNNGKLNWIFVNKEYIEKLANYLKENMNDIRFGICHGSRRGLEQKWFKEYLNCDVIGTEIADTAEQFPNTIQWDFHQVKPEWIGKVDFIYSNSFDHSYDPENCLKQWMMCLKPNGICFLEWTDTHDRKVATHLDPFGASQKGYKELINIRYQLITTLDLGTYPIKSGETILSQKQRWVFVIKNKQS